MSMAFHNVYPKVQLNVNFQLSSAMFCQIENGNITDNITITATDSNNPSITATLSISIVNTKSTI